MKYIFWLIRKPLISLSKSYIYIYMYWNNEINLHDSSYIWLFADLTLADKVTPFPFPHRNKQKSILHFFRDFFSVNKVKAIIDKNIHMLTLLTAVSIILLEHS